MIEFVSFQSIQIVADVSPITEEQPEVSDSEQIDVEEMVVERQPISRIEAQRAFTIVRQSVEQNGDSAVLHLTDALDDFFYKERKKRQIQPKISNFFQSNR